MFEMRYQIIANFYQKNLSLRITSVPSVVVKRTHPGSVTAETTATPSLKRVPGAGRSATTKRCVEVDQGTRVVTNAREPSLR